MAAGKDEEESAAAPVATPGEARAFVVAPEAAGTRLDVHLAGLLGISRAQCRRLLARGGVSLDDRGVAEKEKGLSLSAGSRIEVAAFRRPAEQSPMPEPEGGADPPTVLARGDGWIVVDKPAGMPVHPLNDGETGTVLNAVVKTDPEIVGVGEGGLRCGVVHRLDVWTSGALVVATKPVPWQRLRSAFAEHRVAKRYLALVEGVVDTGAGDVLEMELGLVIARHRPAKVRVAKPAEVGGRSVRPVSQTVRLIESFGDASLVEIRPKTGFLHQIRVTLAHLGHPLVGDRVYGPRSRDAGADLAEVVGAQRHMLHAAEVEIDEVHAEAAWPADFEACRAALAAERPPQAPPGDEPGTGTGATDSESDTP